MQELLAFAVRNPGGPAVEVRCNFGVFAGREATPAELDELAHLLLRIVPDVSVVAEQRREVGPASEAVLYQVRIEVPEDELPADEAGVERLIGRLLQETERWATACTASRPGPT